MFRYIPIIGLPRSIIRKIIILKLLKLFVPVEVEISETPALFRPVFKVIVNLMTDHSKIMQ